MVIGSVRASCHKKGEIKMLDVLLVNPGDVSPYPAMGLAELAVFVRDAGYEVDILDFSLPGTSIGDVLSRDPKVVGISVLCGVVNTGLGLASCIKKETGAFVVLGGYYPTFCYSQ